LALIYFAVISIREAHSLTTVVQVIGGGAGVLLLAGLWTPVAGSLAAFLKVWIAFSQFLSHSGDPWIPIAQAVLSAALAMIGPGAWSIDARLFGRKHINFLER
jgi:putative oxidoreductase